MALANMRIDYGLAGLHENDLAKDPFRQFEQWIDGAVAAKITKPNAMTPETIEFWQERRSRLHDRLRCRRRSGKDWVVDRFAP